VAEVAFLVYDFARGGTAAQPQYAAIIASLRRDYAGQTVLDPTTLANDANATMAAISKSVAGKLAPDENKALFGDLSPVEQDAILKRMATRQVRNPDQVIGEGRFLEFAPRKTLVRFFEAHPELFLDGKYWEDPYEAIEYPTAGATEEARSQVVRQYSELLGDALWLTEKDAEDLEAASRAKLLRASLALELLAPSSANYSSANGGFFLAPGKRLSVTWRGCCYSTHLMRFVPSVVSAIMVAISWG
jgi:hypothetical protein